MPDLKEYLTPSGYGEALMEEKRSRFISWVWPCSTEEEAVRFIAGCRKQHPDAAHNVFAYIVEQGAVIRCSDDGEPQGTSGQPTLAVFQNEHIRNVCCVTTRYFGGVLLGAGGLVRAYGKTAKLALDAAGTSLMGLWNRVLVPCPYHLYEQIRNLLGSVGGSIESSDFAAEIMLDVLLPPQETQAFIDRVMDVSAGSVQALVVDRVLRGVRIR